MGALLRGSSAESALSGLLAGAVDGHLATFAARPRGAPCAGVERDLAALQGQRTVGVDLNAGHLACWVIAPDGNPVGTARTISLGELTPGLGCPTPPSTPARQR